jgi:hypothetical protein
MRNEAMAKKRKSRGHFCWCCGRIRPNQRFSGSGHAHHLCRDCSKLGESELQYRQDLRDLERLITWEGIIGRKKRKAFNRFLEHSDPRIRHYAEELAAEDTRARVSLGSLGNDGHCEPEGCDFEGDQGAAGQFNSIDLCRQNEADDAFDDDDIPF